MYSVLSIIVYSRPRRVIAQATNKANQKKNLTRQLPLAWRALASYSANLFPDLKTKIKERKIYCDECSYPWKKWSWIIIISDETLRTRLEYDTLKLRGNIYQSVASRAFSTSHHFA